MRDFETGEGISIVGILSIIVVLPMRIPDDFRYIYTKWKKYIAQDFSLQLSKGCNAGSMGVVSGAGRRVLRVLEGMLHV